MKKQEYTVVCQRWIESESGWGQSDDGYSLHLDENARQSFVQEYWNGMPSRSQGVPEVYSRPGGDPYFVKVDKKTYDKVKEKFGIRSYDKAPEGFRTVPGG